MAVQLDCMPVDQERLSFQALQDGFEKHYSEVFPNSLAPRTVIVVPSLSLDQETLEKVSGAHHYEKRMLCLLMLLRFPKTQVIFLTSQPIDPVIIDYFLNLLPSVPVNHARRRLTLMACHDGSPRPLVEKILERPRLIERLKQQIRYPNAAHMTCFNTTAQERKLAVQLSVPLFACDPDLVDLGNKSGGRSIFKEVGIPIPDGFENLHDRSEIVDALAELKRRQPDLRRAVVKINEGFSGEGNAVFKFIDGNTHIQTRGQIGARLEETLRFEAKDECFERFMCRYKQMGGIVEAFVEGEVKTSPSVQCRINPDGVTEVISTHDQVMGGPSGQVFKGCTFPANRAYRLEIQEMGARVARNLRDKGALGRLGVDFISVKEGDLWKHYAIEINLRKGGTTHPFMMLQFLTDGTFDPDTGLYLTPTGCARYYFCTDNLEDPAYRGLTAEDLIDISVCRGLHFHCAGQEGVVLHLIGALSEYGKLGVVAIGRSPEAALSLYDRTVAVLAEETGALT